MTKKMYIPDTGHIIQLHFDVSPGSGLPDRRPALVLSPAAYNKSTGLVISCAMTTDIKGYPFEVRLNDHLAVALADQIKSLDWKNTKISYAGRVDANVLTEIRAKLDALIFAL